MYGLTVEQSGLVKQQGECQANLIERQGQFREMFMEDQEETKNRDFITKLGSSGTVVSGTAGRNAIMTQARR